MTKVVCPNSGDARRAPKLASAASDTATHRNQAIDKVVKTIAGISHKSKKMFDIKSAIEGIVSQTYIPRSNAAAEAALAGENGRGFAVVASEVRSLAQRSAAASKEIKDLVENSLAQVEEG